MSHAQIIAKNAAWLMLATTAQKAIAFISFFFVARWNGAEVTGRYFYAVAITSIFVVLTDLGLTPVVIREIASHPERGRAILTRALHAKGFLIPLGVMVSLGYAVLTGASRETLIAVGIACGVMSCDALSLIAYGVLRGYRKLSFEAVGMLVTQIVTACLAIAASRFIPGNVYALVGALLAGSIWNVSWSLWQWRRLKIEPEQKSSIAWREIVGLALPFALAGIFVKIYSYVDTLLLEHFHNDAIIGQYAVAYKITYAFQFLPLTFVAALYPGLSSAHAEGNREALRNVFQGSLRLMMLASVPIAVGISVFSAWIPWLYGSSYQGAVLPLATLAWVLIPIFLDFPIGSLLNATHRAGYKTTAMGISMIVNALVNLWLVPRFGASGAALSGVISFTLLFFIGLVFVRKDVEIKWLLGLLAKGATAALLIWWIEHWSLAHLQPVLAVVLAIFASIGALIVTRLCTQEDVKMVLGWVKKRV